MSLEKYMLLPTDQYNELDPQMIKSLGGSTFLLKVPRLTVRSAAAVQRKPGGASNMPLAPCFRGLIPPFSLI